VSGSVLSGEDVGLTSGGGNGRTSTCSVWVEASVFGVSVCVVVLVTDLVTSVALSTVGVDRKRGSLWWRSIHINFHGVSADDDWSSKCLSVRGRRSGVCCGVRGGSVVVLFLRTRLDSPASFGADLTACPVCTRAEWTAHLVVEGRMDGAPLRRGRRLTLVRGPDERLSSLCEGRMYGAPRIRAELTARLGQEGRVNDSLLVTTWTVEANNGALHYWRGPN